MSDRLTLVTLITENYVERARPFLDSLRRLSDKERVCVCLEFIPSLGLRQDYPHIQFRSMPRHWSESSLGIMQQGRWLDALPDVRDDALYMLTDADMVVQRDFTKKEYVRFANYDKGTFGAAWNGGEGDTLMVEADRLGFHDDATWGEWEAIPCFNTGVLVMRGLAWRRLRDLYESRCERFYKLTSHRSRGQWLMNWCMWRLGMKADVLGGKIHSHGHLGVPKGANLRNGFLYCGDDLVLFRHAL